MCVYMKRWRLERGCTHNGAVERQFSVDTNFLHSCDFTACHMIDRATGQIFLQDVHLERDRRSVGRGGEGEGEGEGEGRE